MCTTASVPGQKASWKVSLQAHWGFTVGTLWAGMLNSHRRLMQKWEDDVMCLFPSYDLRCCRGCLTTHPHDHVHLYLRCPYPCEDLALCAHAFLNCTLLVCLTGLARIAWGRLLPDHLP